MNTKIIFLILILFAVPFAAAETEVSDAPIWDRLLKTFSVTYYNPANPADVSCREKYECMQNLDGTYKTNCYSRTDTGILSPLQILQKVEPCICFTSKTRPASCPVAVLQSDWTTPISTYLQNNQYLSKIGVVNATQPSTTTPPQTTTQLSTTTKQAQIIQNGPVKITPTPIAECGEGVPCVSETNTITVEVPLKNTGSDMTTPWIIELRVDELGVFMSYESIIGSQQVCDSSRPQNVYRTFIIKSGETATLRLTSTVTLGNIGPNEVNRFDLYLNTYSGCCNSANGCNKVSAPNEWLISRISGGTTSGGAGGFIGTVDLKKPTGGETPPGPECGDGTCSDPYFENSVTCPQDCKESTIVCGNRVCESGENKDSCWYDCQESVPVCIGCGTSCQKGTYEVIKKSGERACCQDGTTYDKETNLCNPGSGTVCPSPQSMNICIPEGCMYEDTINKPLAGILGSSSSITTCCEGSSKHKFQEISPLGFRTIYGTCEKSEFGLEFFTKTYYGIPVWAIAGIILLFVILLMGRGK